MARSVNKVILLGRLGKDAETRFTPSGVPRTTFSMATDRRWKDQQTGEWKEETDWHNVVIWRRENVANFLTKGKQIYVEGRIQSRSYDDKDGNKRYITEVVADDVVLLGDRGDAAGASGGGAEYGTPYEADRGPVSMPRSAQQQKRPVAAAEPDNIGDQGIGDDDVPF